MRDAMACAATAVAAVFVLAACPDAVEAPPAFTAALFFEKALLVALLVAAAFVDARRRIIPNAIPAGVIGLHAVFIPVLAVAGGPGAAPSVGAAIVGLVALGGGVLVFTLAYEAIVPGPVLGGGDIKLIAALGFALGWERGLLVVMLACMAFACWAAASAIRARLQGRKTPRAFPFAPSIAVGIWVLFALA